MTSFIYDEGYMKRVILNLVFPVEIEGTVSKETLQSFVAVFLDIKLTTADKEGGIEINHPIEYSASIVSENLSV